MIDEVWSDTPKDKRPKVIGFDNDFGGAAYNRTLSAGVLETAKPFLHAFTYHQYGCGGGPDPNCVDNEYLHGGGDGKSGSADYNLVRKVVPSAEIWLGEGGGQGCASGPGTQQLKSRAHGRVVVARRARCAGALRAAALAARDDGGRLVWAGELDTYVPGNSLIVFTPLTACHNTLYLLPQVWRFTRTSTRRCCSAS